MAGLKYLESSIVYGNTLYMLDWDVENIENWIETTYDDIQIEI